MLICKNGLGKVFKVLHYIEISCLGTKAFDLYNRMVFNLSDLDSSI